MMYQLLVASLEWLQDRTRWQKRATVFILDAVLLIFSVWFAYSLRTGVWTYFDRPIANMATGCFAFMVLSFTFAGVYRAIFRYAGVGTMRILLRAFGYYSAMMVSIYLVVGIPGVPRTIGLIQPIIFFGMVAGSRLVIRYLMIDLLGRSGYGGSIKRVMVYGAGQAGQQLVSSLRPEPSMQVVGYFDDDSRLDGQELDGYRVYASEHLQTVLRNHAITNILLAMPNIGRRRRADIIETLSEYQVDVKTLPPMTEIVGGTVSFSDLRSIEIEDLLGREPVHPNEVLLGRTIIGKSVLVTGAGGSIGSELCRQILSIGARTLLVLDQSEYALYSIETELRDWASQNGCRTDIVPLLASVTDRTRISEIFETFAIDTIFHAAAYKHVPLIEANPVDGVRNNVLGTLSVAQAAFDHQAGAFILVSTDKAVRPTNVMGASKRGAELIVQSFARRAQTTKFSMVRFGNVLASSGSVVPLFQKQIETGGPVTVTDMAVTRYFMTISEAASLVIQAGGLAKGGEVFLLDMGKPMKIANLAEAMIRLSGLTLKNRANPDGDIEIREIGLRPGEKLYEELLIGKEAIATAHPRIMMGRETSIDPPQLSALLAELASVRDRSAMVGILEKLVPEFSHRRDNRVKSI